MSQVANRPVLPSLEETLKSIVAQELDLDPSAVTLDSALLDDLGADSMNVVGIAMAVEVQFGIPLAKERLEGVRTVRDIIGYIEDQHGGGT